MPFTGVSDLIDHGPAGWDPRGLVADKIPNFNKVPPLKSWSKIFVRVKVLLSAAIEQSQTVKMTEHP